MVKESKLIATVKKCGEKILNMVTPKRVSILLTIIYVVSLIPLLWISFYNYPSADDYSIGSSCHQMWVTSHSIFRTLWQGVLNAAHDWLHWMGYFTSNFLMAVPPSTFGERWYVLTAWIMIGMLSLSTIYLIRCIIVKVFHGDKYISNSISMIILFASVQCMCPAGRVEAFYWYSGAANYILLHSMSLFFLGLLVSAYYDAGKKRTWDLVAASILGFLVGGGNQMTALNVAVVVLVAVVMMSVQKAWERGKSLRVPIGLFYFGFIVNVAAPGNWVRAEGASGMNPVKAVFVSLYECLDRVIGEWTTWPIVILMIMLIPLFWQIVGKITFKFQYPGIVVLFGYGLVSAMMTPPIFAVGNMEAGRLQALTYLMYILILSLCVGYVTGWVRKKLDTRSALWMQSNEFTVAQRWCVLICIVFIVFGSAITVIPEPHYFTYSSALVDLTDGSAKAYGETLRERAVLYNNGKGGVVVVEVLPAQPKLLYFSDVKEESDNWENRGVSKFYGLDAVLVRK